MQFLVWLQESSLSYWVGTSPSLWAYPGILTFHTVGLALVVGSSAVLDFRLLGFGRGIPIAELRPLFRILWIGFVINALTGVALFVAAAEFTGTKPIFYIKLGFVFLGLWTAVVLKRSVFGPSAPADLDTSVPVKMRILAMCSLALWAAAITAGRYTAYFD